MNQESWGTLDRSTLEYVICSLLLFAKYHYLLVPSASDSHKMHVDFKFDETVTLKKSEE